MTLLDPFKRFFQEPNPRDEAIAECNEIIEFSEMAYYARLMAYLERVADEPFKIGNDAVMIESAARINAFKEIRKHLKDQVQKAHLVLERERSDV